MIRVNIKLDYILPHFIQFSKQLLLFIAVENNIQKQPFTDVLQIGVLKSFAILTGKCLCPEAECLCLVKKR